MKALLEFITRHNHWFLFLLLEVVSAVLLFRFNHYQGSAWFSSANYVAGKTYEMNSKMEAYLSLTTLNEELTQRNVELEQQLHALGEALADLSHDSTYRDPQQFDGVGLMRLIPAKVVSSQLDRADNLLTINRGAADGVERDMGVVSGHGVVGVVYLVSTHYAVVMPVLNSHSSISCSIKGSGYFGSLQWKGGDVGVASVDGIPLHARFETGDSIVTSGYSSIFPAGILVGTIKGKTHSANGLFYRLEVNLATDFGRLRDVCVVDNSSMREQLNLLRAAKDSLGVVH